MATTSTTITSAMTAALQTAVTNANSIISAAGATTIDDLSLDEVQQVIAVFMTAYNVFAAGNGTPAGIDLDAITATSTLDGITALNTEVNLVNCESDVQICLGYLGRIIQNLSLAAG